MLISLLNILSAPGARATGFPPLSWLTLNSKRRVSRPLCWSISGTMSVMGGWQVLVACMTRSNSWHSITAHAPAGFRYLGREGMGRRAEPEGLMGKEIYGWGGRRAPNGLPGDGWTVCGPVSPSSTGHLFFSESCSRILAPDAPPLSVPSPRWPPANLPAFYFQTKLQVPHEHSVPWTRTNRTRVSGDPSSPPPCV